MRILNLCFSCRRGGIEQAFVDYGEALSLAGHEVHMLCEPEMAYGGELQRLGLPVLHLRQRGAWDIAAALRLRRMIRQVAPDLIIAHGNRAVSLLTAPLMKPISNPPCPVMAVAHNYQLKRFARLDGACAITRHIAGELERRGMPAARIFHMPNMVRVPASPPRRPVWRNPPVIGAMGRFVAKKGFDDLLAALALLRERSVPFRAVIAGDGEEADALRRRCAESGLENAVTFPGWAEDKAAFFQSCDIFCLPSRHEPFGIVLIEAMSHALPIVSTRSEGPSEILGDGEDALLCGVGDTEGMADALARLLGDMERAAALGSAAFAKVRWGYGIEAAGVRLDGIARAVAAMGRAKM